MLKSIGESKLVKPIIGLMLMSMVLSFSMSILGMPISSKENDKPAVSTTKVLPKPAKDRNREVSVTNPATMRQNSKQTVLPDNNQNPQNEVAANATAQKYASNVQLSSNKPPQPKFSSNVDIYLLARVIYAESRGEPFQGQVAVGAVLLNRLDDSRFPKSLPQIIFKKGEFCTVRDGQIWKNPSPEAIKAARLAAAGWDPTGGALYFYNPAKTTSRWIWSRPVVNRIGNHIFAA